MSISLIAGKTYRFRVVVVYADSERKVGPVSAKVTLTSGSGGTSGKTRMPAPVIVEAHSVSKNKVYIGWQVRYITFDLHDLTH